ncbi:hypothetical protein ACTHOQ_17790 [Solibacillus silvestris]|uniref:hypothetical protein n=1 Tax=Solibacillus silvestris TaxID=76853 RepID=UPI003F7F4392
MTLGQHIRVFVCVVIIGCIAGYVLTASEIETESPYIDYIQAQTLLFGEEQTIGTVFHDFYELTYWEYFTALKGEHVVQFTGTKNEQRFVFQFIVEEDHSDFTLGALKQNDILLPPEEKWAYVEFLHKQKNVKS